VLVVVVVVVVVVVLVVVVVVLVVVVLVRFIGRGVRRSRRCSWPWTSTGWI
jgi:hypothetical protein